MTSRDRPFGGSPTLCGIVAGAAGTSALNCAAYLDMALTRRASSDVPRKAARSIARLIGQTPKPEDDAATLSRWEGFGEALGYAHGTGQGIGYGNVRARLLPNPPWWVGGLIFGTECFLTGETVTTSLGATDPRTWGVAGTLRGLVLRVIYGVVTAAVFDAIYRAPEAGA